MSRIYDVFNRLKKINQTAFVAYITAGDPDVSTSQDILNILPECGVDIIELGMPFTDPMADGTTIQNAHIRSLKNAHTMNKTLSMVHNFRDKNTKTPIILMGYYNPIFCYGVEKFLIDAKSSGVDGVLIVDLPPEEEEEFTSVSCFYNIDLIRLITPTSNQSRIEKIINNASGFLYYVSMNGITGNHLSNTQDLTLKLKEIRSFSNLPIVVGFGIKNTQDIIRIKNFGADGLVIGSAIVEKIAGLSSQEKQFHNINIIKAFLEELSDAVKGEVL